MIRVCECVYECADLEYNKWRSRKVVFARVNSISAKNGLWFERCCNIIAVKLKLNRCRTSQFMHVWADASSRACVCIHVHMTKVLWFLFCCSVSPKLLCNWKNAIFLFKKKRIDKCTYRYVYLSPICDFMQLCMLPAEIRLRWFVLHRFFFLSFSLSYNLYLFSGFSQYVFCENLPQLIESLRCRNLCFLSGRSSVLFYSYAFHNPTERYYGSQLTIDSAAK